MASPIIPFTREERIRLAGERVSKYPTRSVGELAYREARGGARVRTGDQGVLGLQSRGRPCTPAASAQSRGHPRTPMAWAHTASVQS